MEPWCLPRFPSKGTAAGGCCHSLAVTSPVFPGCHARPPTNCRARVGVRNAALQGSGAAGGAATVGRGVKVRASADQRPADRPLSATSPFLSQNHGAAPAWPAPPRLMAPGPNYCSAARTATCKAVAQAVAQPLCTVARRHEICACLPCRRGAAAFLVGAVWRGTLAATGGRGVLRVYR